MTFKGLWRVLGVLGVLFILSSLLITFVEYRRFTSRQVTFPPGSEIAGLPVDGLDRVAAEDRLVEFYSLPLVLEFNDATIHASMADLGFTLDIPGLVQTGLEQVETVGFWGHLWNRSPSREPIQVPLAGAVDERQVLAYLNGEIAPRYTQPGSPVAPIPWTTNYMPESSGDRLVVESALRDIEEALYSPTMHHVRLHTEPDVGADTSWEVLAAFLQHNLQFIGFDGLVEIYLESMETGQVLQLAVTNETTIVQPDIAFPAASTNKIPIMVSVLRRVDEPTPEAVVDLFTQMIARSENPPADVLMAVYLDEIRGPLIVSEDLAALGMENSFLGMYYTDPTPLVLFDTPANTRQDVFLAPDRFNQTIPAESGRLLTAIYQCAEGGDGLLIETFPEEITPASCQLMIDILLENRIGLLIEAGLPYGASAAHKHGWAPDLDGQLRFMSDVGIVFTDGGDYVLNIFIHEPVRLDFNQGNRLIARLSQTVYNFFNIENQAHWWFD